MELLQKLCSIAAPSGNEAPMKKFILDYLNENMSNFKVKPIVISDGIQDCLILKFGKPKTAVFAHLDSIGYTVRYDKEKVKIGGTSGYVSVNCIESVRHNSVNGNSSMAETLGLGENGTITGIFSTFLHLAFPSYVCFSSPLLTAHGEHIHAGKQPSHIQIQPFLTVPISSGFLDQQVFDPVLAEGWLPLHNSGSHIDIRVFDPSSGREYTEATHWSLLIEIE